MAAREPKTAADRMCVCRRWESEHDAKRADHRCLESGCEGFRLSAAQPAAVPEKHRTGHGPKPGKGLPWSWKP